MSEVNVTINARQYRMACEDGQEEHLLKLAEDLDKRIGQLRASFGEIGDMRLTVMAALTVADEVVETGKTVRRLEDELAALTNARVIATDRGQATQAALIAAFNAAAARIEGLTKKLNQTVGSNEVAIG
jgi:cell division protein ZapA